MTTYNVAVDKSTKSATAFMEQIHHLTQAWDAYHEAMTASAELRNVLDAGDEALRTLMSNLEQAIDVHQGRPGLRNKPEPLKLELIRETGESNRVMKTFP